MCKEYLRFNGENYLSLKCAFDYLEDESAIYELETLYFHYKGFAEYDIPLPNEPLPPSFRNEFEYCYLDGVTAIRGNECQSFWKMRAKGDNIWTSSFLFHSGTINGKEIIIQDGLQFDLVREVFANDSNVYVKKSDLDALSKNYGIPKKSHPPAEPKIVEDEDNVAKGYKPHGNTEVYAKKREQVLGAALSVMAQWPDQCKNNSGKFEATKIRTLIEEKSYLFWPLSGEPPLKTETIERLIREWIKKTDT